MADAMSSDVYKVLFLVLIFNGNNMRATGLVRACVFNTYARHRTNKAKFTVADIDFNLCTHLIYHRASLNANNIQIVPVDPTAEMSTTSTTGLYARFNSAKLAHPGIKTLLTVGGPETEQSLQFRSLFLTSPGVQVFAGNALTFLRTHGFDGINLYWSVDTIDMAKQNFTKLLQAFRTAIDLENHPSKLLLTIMGHAALGHIQLAYDVSAIGSMVDYVFVMAYQFSSRRFASFNGPLFPGTSPNISPHANINFSIHSWNYRGCPFEKIVLGVSALGSFVKLASPETQFQPGAPITNDVLYDDLYFIDRALAIPEVCRRHATFRRYYDNVQKNPYLVKGAEWIGFEDKPSMGEKIIYVQSMGLAGIMFNNIDEDDFNATECRSEKFPLLSYIKKNLDRDLTKTAPTTRMGGATTTPRSVIPGQTTALQTVTASAWPDEFETSTVTSPHGTYTFQPAHEEDHGKWSKYLLLVLLLILGYGLGYLCMSCVRRGKPTSGAVKTQSGKHSSRISR